MPRPHVPLASAPAQLPVSLRLLGLGLCLLLVCTQDVQARKGYGAGGQEWGFIDVREGAHTFYWLYYAGGGSDAGGKPLVLWLQGGPGGSSSGYGNFVEVGPMNYKGENRTCSWSAHVNLLFIDNPVGSGFSYVDSFSRYVTKNKQIADDLVTFMKKFLKTYPVFKTLPMFIFTESYGGKMVSEFAYYLYKEKEAGNIEVNLTAIALGDSWISPNTSVFEWAPFLVQTSVLDTAGYEKVNGMAERMQRELDAGRMFQATQVWDRIQNLINELAGDIDFYYITDPEYLEADEDDDDDETAAVTLLKTARSGRRKRNLRKSLMRERLLEIDPSDATLDQFIDKYVKPALNLTGYFYSTENINVYNALWGDIMTPVKSFVEKLLAETPVKVVVYSAQLDLIVGTSGTLKWVNEMNWSGLDEWKATNRTTLVVDDIIQGFSKSYGNFTFYWILRAGHMVPLYNPEAALAMMKEITKYDEY